MQPPSTVLVVEDNADALEPLCTLLQLKGYEVVGARDAASAMARMAEQVFDAVVLDLGLPDVDGLVLIPGIRAASSNVAIVAFTGFHRLETLARDAGCDAFVVKPNIDGLLTGLETAIAGRRRLPTSGTGSTGTGHD